MVSKRASHSEKFDAVLIQRAAVAGYPPVLHQAAILANEGLSVAVVDGARSDRRPMVDGRIVYFSPLSRRQEPTSYFGRAIDHLRFLWSLASNPRIRRARVRIMFDPTAVCLGSVLPGDQVRVSHFHEEPESKRTHRTRRWMSRRLCRLSDLIVVPDEFRAVAFQWLVGLSDTPHVVFNCPRKKEQLPEPRLRSDLGSRAGEWKRIVLYQGSIGPRYCLEEVIRSMEWWGPDAAFVINGFDHRNLQGYLEEVAKEVGVSQRVGFLEPVEYESLSSRTVGASLMVTGSRDQNFKAKYSAGASNKRFEAMACGVPQVTDAGTGVREVVEMTGAGVCQDFGDIEGLGRTINDLLSDERLLAEMASAGRRAHLDRYNYEDQFAPVLERIKADMVEKMDSGGGCG